MSKTPATGAEREGVRADRLRRLRRMLERYQHRRNGALRRSVSTGLDRLDRALPRGGLPAGAITEIFSPLEGGGAMALAFRAARAAAEDAQTVVVVDTRGDFYPPAAWRLGILRDHLLVIRAAKIDQALWAIDQTLRCCAVAAVVAPLRRIDEAASRRLQLAAESSGTIALLLRPAADRRRSFAAVQMLVEPVPAFTRLCRVTLLKVREGMPVEPFIIDLGHETGNVPLLPVPVHRPAASDRQRISA